MQSKVLFGILKIVYAWYLVNLVFGIPAKLEFFPVQTFTAEDLVWKNMHVSINVRVRHHCLGPPFLFGVGLLSTGATPSSFYLLVEGGVTITSFSRIDVLITGQGLYKKTPP